MAKPYNVPKGQVFILEPAVNQQVKDEIRMKLWCDVYAMSMAKPERSSVIRESNSSAPRAKSEFPHSSLFAKDANRALREFDEAFGGVAEDSPPDAAEKVEDSESQMLKEGTWALQGGKWVRVHKPSGSKPPRWRCRKEVVAYKIKEVVKHAHEGPEFDDSVFESSTEFAGASLFIDDHDNPCPVGVSADWYRRNQPEKGGYYVVHEGGSTSYLPADEFEEMYERI